MNLTDSDLLRCQMGAPIFLDDICAIYPATLREIVLEGYENFQKYLGIITTEKPTDAHADNELSQLLNELSDFQYLIMMATIDLETNQLLKSAFRFFTHEEIIISLNPPQIVLGPLEEKHIIDEGKYADFKSIIRKMYFLDIEGDEIIINDDDDPYTKRIKMDLRKARELRRKAAAAKAMREKTNLKFSDLIGSLTLNNCNLNIANVWDITYYSFHDQLKRMGWRDQFDINQKAALAGAKIDKSDLKHWMRSMANSDES